MFGPLLEVLPSLTLRGPRPLRKFRLGSTEPINLEVLVVVRSTPLPRSSPSLEHLTHIYAKPTWVESQRVHVHQVWQFPHNAQKLQATGLQHSQRPSPRTESRDDRAVSAVSDRIPSVPASMSMTPFMAEAKKVYS